VDTLRGGRGDIKKTLSAANALGASDIFFTGSAMPMARVNGKLKPIGADVINDFVVQQWIRTALKPEDQLRLESLKTVDVAYEPADLGRYRAHVTKIEGRVSVALRKIPDEIPELVQLGLPEKIGEIARMSRGLVLIVGATGSGKSTTLSAILNQMNRNREHHIVTIEDPIEFAFPPGNVGGDGKSWVTQLEVGRDVVDFASGFKNSLRHNPDVIAIGEIRDRETFEVALHAAESGHLVLSTLHATDAAEAVHRFVGFFQPEEQNQVRQRLSLALKMVVAQRLVTTDKGDGRVPAAEILIHNERVREIIASPDRLHEIVEVIEESHQTFGMQSFDQSLMDLLTAGRINLATALAAASRPGLFEMWMRGVTSQSEAPRWSPFQNGQRVETSEPDDLHLEKTVIDSDTRMAATVSGRFRIKQKKKKKAPPVFSLENSSTLAAAVVGGFMILVIALIRAGSPEDLPKDMERKIAMAEISPKKLHGTKTAAGKSKPRKGKTVAKRGR
jgi:twitching motility protein PilT